MQDKNVFLEENLNIINAKLAQLNNNKIETKDRSAEYQSKIES